MTETTQTNRLIISVALRLMLGSNTKKPDQAFFCQKLKIYHELETFGSRLANFKHSSVQLTLQLTSMDPQHLPTTKQNNSNSSKTLRNSTTRRKYFGKAIWKKLRLNQHQNFPDNLSMLCWLSMQVKNLLTNNEHHYITTNQIRQHCRIQLLGITDGKGLKGRGFTLLEKDCENIVIRRAYDVLSVFVGLGIVEAQICRFEPTDKCYLTGKNVHPYVHQLKDLQTKVKQKQAQIDRKIAYIQLSRNKLINIQWLRGINKTRTDNWVKKQIESQGDRKVQLPLLIAKFKKGSHRKIIVNRTHETLHLSSTRPISILPAIQLIDYLKDHNGANLQSIFNENHIASDDKIKVKQEQE